jgi:hypothetical protein
MPDYHNGKRVYRVGGKRFSIVSLQRPADQDLVYFTDREWTFLKSRNLSAEEFAIEHERKRVNHTYSPIPPEQLAQDRAAGAAACRSVLEMLKKKSTAG